MATTGGSHMLDFCGTVMLYTRSIWRTPACRSTTSTGARTSVRRSMGMTPAGRTTACHHALRS